MIMSVAVSLAYLTISLVIFHSIRKTAPSHLFGAAVAFMCSALAVGFCLNSQLTTFEVNASIISMFITLFGSIILMQLSITHSHKLGLKPVEVESN